MEDIHWTDEAQLRHEFRQFYKDYGAGPSIQALYEMMVAANILLEIVIEEGHLGKD